MEEWFEFISSEEMLITSRKHAIKMEEEMMKMDDKRAANEGLNDNETILMRRCRVETQI